MRHSAKSWKNPGQRRSVPRAVVGQWVLPLRRVVLQSLALKVTLNVGMTFIPLNLVVKVMEIPKKWDAIVHTSNVFEAWLWTTTTWAGPNRP